MCLFSVLYASCFCSQQQGGEGKSHQVLNSSYSMFMTLSFASSPSSPRMDFLFASARTSSLLGTIMAPRRRWSYSENNGVNLLLWLQWALIQLSLLHSNLISSEEEKNDKCMRIAGAITPQFQITAWIFFPLRHVWELGASGIEMIGKAKISLLFKIE